MGHPNRRAGQPLILTGKWAEESVDNVLQVQVA